MVTYQAAWVKLATWDKIPHQNETNEQHADNRLLQMRQKLNDRPKHGHSKQSLASRRTRQSVFLKTKSWDFSSVITLCPMIMPSMNGSPYSSTQIFFVYPSWIYHVQLTVDLSLCQKADHPDVAQLSEKVWFALPIQLTNWRISWPWARSESLSPPSKTIGASWEMVVVRTSTFHWSWCRKVQALWVHGSLSQEINAVVRRIILNLEESCGAVQLWNPSEHLEFVADWQIVGQDYGSGEEDWCLSRWEA